MEAPIFCNEVAVSIVKNNVVFEFYYKDIKFDVPDQERKMAFAKSIMLDLDQVQALVRQLNSRLNNPPDSQKGGTSRI